MSIEIRELRCDDFDQVVALYRSANGTDDGSAALASETDFRRFLQANPGLSLGARDASGFVGIILGRRSRDGGVTNDLILPSQPADAQMGHRLCDKASGKLTAKGIHHVRVRRPAEKDGDDFWETLRWTDQPDLMPDAAPPEGGTGPKAASPSPDGPTCDRAAADRTDPGDSPPS